MTRFFPRDVIHWGEEQLHPLRAFAVRTLASAAITGITMRLFRALVLGATASAGWVGLVTSLVLGVLFLCGMLTWHLGNFPIKRWPLRVIAFVVIEVAAEVATSAALIVVHWERFGTRVAEWSDWWPMAFQTFSERGIGLVLFAMVLAGSVQTVRRIVDRRAVE